MSEINTDDANCFPAPKPPGRSDLGELKLKGGETSDGYPPQKFVGVELTAI